MKKNNALFQFLILIILLFTFSGCSSIDSKDPNYNPQPDVPDHSGEIKNLRVEETTKGVFLRWDDITGGMYNLNYSLKITGLATNGEEAFHEVTTVVALPVYEFTNYCYDEDINFTFQVKVGNSTTGTYLDDCEYFYDTSLIHFTSSPKVEQIAMTSVDNPYLITWESPCDEFKIVFTRTNSKNVTTTISRLVKKTEDGCFFNASDLANNARLLTFKITALGTGEIGKGYFHDSVESESYEIVNLLE
jgi:hypothetical protein